MGVEGAGRRVQVLALALTAACGVETAADGSETSADDGESVPVTPPSCEPGPEIVATVETCELTVEGLDGPTAARMWTFSADDNSTWTRFALADDGGFYLLDDERRPEGNLVLLITRFGPNFEFEWSRRLVHAATTGTLALSASLRAFAVDDLGIALSTELDTNPSFGPRPDAWWLTHIGTQGGCAESFPIELGGSSRCYVGSVLLEPDSLVLAGIAYVSTDPIVRGYIQRRSFGGELLAEAELPGKYGVTHARAHAHGSSPYLVEYHEVWPFSYWGTISRAGIHNSSLAMTGARPLPEHPLDLGVRSDAFGQLYSVARDEWDNAESHRQPQRLDVAAIASDDEPAGESVELLIAQPQCGEVSFALFDGTFATVRCSAPDLAATLTGYAGSGEPAWMATLSCPDAAELRLEPSGLYGEDGRLWWSARADRRVLIEVEF